MKENLKLGFILCIITAVAGLFLGLANELTKDVIAQNAKMSKEDVAYILPGATTIKDFEFDKESEEFVTEAYEISSDSQVIGYAIKSVSKGYGGEIDVLVGIKSDGELGGVKVLSQSETPGLGAKVEEENFIGQYRDMPIADSLKVVKGSKSNDNEVEAITGATISSNAVTKAVNDAMNFYKENILGEEVASKPTEPVLELLGLQGEMEPHDIELVDTVEKVWKVIDDTTHIGYVVEICEEGMYEGLRKAIGISIDNNVTGVQILTHNETPGLGDLIEEDDFLNKFVGVSNSSEVDVIAGSTMSSSAVIRGVQTALDLLGGTTSAAEINIVTPSLDVLGLKGELSLMDIEVSDSVKRVYEVINGGEASAYAIELEEKGMKSGFNMAVGLSKDGVVTGVEIISHKETPDIVVDVEKDQFRNQFVGMAPDSKQETIDAVAGSTVDISEYGDVIEADVVSGATLSSMAVIKGVTNALNFYNNNLK